MKKIFISEKKIKNLEEIKNALIAFSGD